MHTLRHCTKVAKTFVTSRPITPNVLTGRPQSAPSLSYRSLVSVPRKTAQGKVDCSCAGHPWPVEEAKVKHEKKKIDCTFDFKKLEVNPFEGACDCKDPPPAAGCKDLGRPKDVCCRSIRQYGCYCKEEEEEEESCEEEEEAEEVVHTTCDFNFRKLEVNPYDDPCECHDPPVPNSCDSLGNKDVCCRSPMPFGCPCDAYDEPGLECLKPKTAPEKWKMEKKQCDKKEYKAQCM